MLIVQCYAEGSVNISEDFRKLALLGTTVHSLNVKRLAKQQPHADIDGNHYVHLISSITFHVTSSRQIRVEFSPRQQDFLSVGFPAASSPWHPAGPLQNASGTQTPSPSLWGSRRSFEARANASTCLRRPDWDVGWVRGDHTGSTGTHFDLHTLPYLPHS